MLILAAVGAVAAYAIYKSTLGKKWSDEEGRNALQSAGLDVYPSTMKSDDEQYGAGKVTFAKSGDTLYRFAPGDLAKFNPAQKILLVADAVVPGSWLSRLVMNRW